MVRPLALRATAIALALPLGLFGGVAAPLALAAEDRVPHAAPAVDAPAVIPSGKFQPAEFQPRIMEGYPAWIIDRLKLRDQKILDDLGDKHSSGAVPSALIIFRAAEWTPGSKITVAFNGGTPRLHALIERIVSEWSEFANIKFDFGRDANGHYRTWSPSDLDYKADVRVAFQADGYWSAIGKDAINPDLYQPGTQTLNLHGYDLSLPFGFEGIARHEFGHVLGLEHEHQSPVVTCDFRWADDPGYVPTTDQSGAFTHDSKNRFPGIYTYMEGPPNKWSKPQIDFNLLPLSKTEDAPVTAYSIGPFDKLSIMKYYYPDWMFASGKNSKCYSPSENYDLSAEDKQLIAASYPKDATAAATLLEKKRQAIELVLSQVPQSSLLAKGLQLKQQRLQ
jgi:hypothetical protein